MHNYEIVWEYARSTRDGHSKQSTMDHKITVVRSFMHPGRLIEAIDLHMTKTTDTITVPVMIAGSTSEAEDILDALEDEIKDLPGFITLRAFNNVIFIDIRRCPDAAE